MEESELETGLPAQPVSPRIFVEDVIPSLFVDLDLTPAERAIELRLGFVLEGGAGGEWTLHFVDGELGIDPVRDPACDVTIRQRVEDWRAALWEGRPAFVADVVDRVFRSGAGSTTTPRRPPDPIAIAELRRLRGLLRIRVAATRADAEDWSVEVFFGPGPMPSEPAATIDLGAEQAESIHRGELHPLEALMTGQLRLEGDLGLVLQIQAIAMLASRPR